MLTLHHGSNRVLSPDGTEDCVVLCCLHVSSFISPIKEASALWKTGHQGGYSLKLGFNTWLCGEGHWKWTQAWKCHLCEQRGSPCLCSYGISFRPDMWCQWPDSVSLTLWCICVGEILNVAALKYEETLHHLPFFSLLSPHPAHNFSSCLSIR